MLKSWLFLGLIFSIVVISACQKSEVYDESSQFVKDEELIKKWLDSTKIPMLRDNNGVYYQILAAGTGTESIELNDSLNVLYAGRLLRFGSLTADTSSFSRTTDTATYKFRLKNVMPGWQYGLPLVKQGGKIRLLIPSPLAYKDYTVTGVPPNSVLDFTIDLKKVVK
ncbi:FKBP-type peptidyl-prolyl cis-trans isomerase [Pedobacter metabolipauper]|nr:FKBP-type peptidyl-prolyl cis-trans isomerase [Pedobacter metabolipauper]